MFNNYLKILLRSFVNDTMFMLIIVFGLSIGIAAILIISQYVQYERSFDKDQKDASKIFYAYMHWESEGGTTETPAHPAIAPFVKGAIPEVESFVRLAPIRVDKGNDVTIRTAGGGSKFKYTHRENVYWADSNAVNFFGLKLIEGNPSTCLSDPKNIVITKSLSRTLYGNASPIDSLVILPIMGTSEIYKVAGVLEDSESNSSIQYSAFLPLDQDPAFSSYIGANWTWPIFRTFIKLNPSAHLASVQEKINTAAKPHLDRLKNDYSIMESIHLFPLEDYHFYRPYNNDKVGSINFTGDNQIIKFFIIIAVIILIISCKVY